MVSVRGVRKAFKSLQAVDGVSFEVTKGQCFGLLGPNGAGKSTVISMIVGTLKPDSGEVLIDGKQITKETDPVRNRVGYVPQEIALFEDLNCIQNLSFFGSLYSLPKDQIHLRSDAVLKMVGLSDRSKEPVKNFSGGMKRRLNIAAALMHEPDLLILDEPTVGVDPQSRNAIFDVLEQLRADGMTLLYTSHYMEEVERLCDQIAIMDQGKIIQSGDLESLLDLLPSRLRLRFTFNSDEMASYAAGQFPTQTTVENSIVEYWPSSGQTAIADSILVLQKANLMFDDLKIERGSLEEVFLHCTGRSLRD